MSPNRVKLPKSFLAVNLSESHTFHKKEESAKVGDEPTTIAEMQAQIAEEAGALSPSGLSGNNSMPIPTAGDADANTQEAKSGDAESQQVSLTHRSGLGASLSFLRDSTLITTEVGMTLKT